MSANFFYRSGPLEYRSTGADMEVDLSISSETPVKRFFGNEILQHVPGAVDFSRLHSALLNHDANTILGRVDNARLDGRKARASIVFDDDTEGRAAWQKVQSGSLKGASVGYVIHKFRELKPGETWEGFRGPAYVATRWSIYELSLTPIPADPNVGVGRSFTRSLDEIEIQQSSFKDERIIMDGRAYSELLSRAQAIGSDAVLKFAEWVRDGRSEAEITGKLLDLAVQRRGGTGTGRKLSDVDEDAFVRSITNPYYN